MTSAKVVETSLTVNDNSPFQDNLTQTITLHDRLLSLIVETIKIVFFLLMWLGLSDHVIQVNDILNSFTTVIPNQPYKP